MVVKNLKELERELRTRIDYALLTDVTEVVTTVMLDHIERDVYDSYVPHEYVRRYDNGGLMDINNIILLSKVTLWLLKTTQWLTLIFLYRGK